MKFFSVLGAAVVVCAIASAGLPAQAGVVFDTGLAEGTYFGSGNPNTHWTVGEFGDVEMGLQASIPYVGPLTPVDNVYSVATNTVWNFNFSAYTGLNGSTLTLLPPGSVQTILTVKDFRTGNTWGSVSPIVISDNATKTNSSGLENGYQNSESFNFASIKAFFDPDYDITKDDTYLFTFAASTDAGPIGQTQMYVKVGKGFVPVPEPASLAIFGTMLLGLGFVVQRRRHSPSTAAA